METYANEEERLEALQRWWKENWQSVIGGILAGIVVIVAWKMWQGNRQAVAGQASNLYQQLIMASEAKQTESAIKLGERITQQYDSTAYADFARLFVAKAKVESGDLAGAKKALEDLLAKTSDENLKHLARLRLARVMLEAGETDPAIKLLEPFTPSQTGKFEGSYQELRGDLYAAANRPDEARKAYESAKEFGEASPLLQLKLDDLAAKPAAPAP